MPVIINEMEVVLEGAEGAGQGGSDAAAPSSADGQPEGNGAAGGSNAGLSPLDLRSMLCHQWERLRRLDPR